MFIETDNKLNNGITVNTHQLNDILETFEHVVYKSSLFAERQE